MERAHWQDAIAFFVGIGLVAAVFVLKVTPPAGVSLAVASWNFIAVGVAVLAVAGSALYACGCSCSSGSGQPYRPGCWATAK